MVRIQDDAQMALHPVTVHTKACIAVTPGQQYVKEVYNSLLFCLYLVQHGCLAP